MIEAYTSPNFLGIVAAVGELRMTGVNRLLKKSVARAFGT
jgi:hypothetical protein